MRFLHANQDAAAASGAQPEATHVVAEWKGDSPLLSCRIDPTGRYVFAGCELCSVRRFDIETGAQTTLAAHDSWVRGMAFAPDGGTLYAADFAGNLVWWPVASEQPEPIRTVAAHQGFNRAVAVSPDGATLATAGNDLLVRLWNAQDGSAAGEFAGHESHIYNVLFHPDGKSLVTADLKGVVKHWDLPTGNCVRDFDASKNYIYDKGFRADIGGARSMAFDASGTQLAFGGVTNVTNAFAGVGNASVVLFDWESGKEIQFHRDKDDLRGVLWGLAFHEDGFLIGAAGGGGGGYIYFWRRDAAHPFFRMKLPNTARDMDLHPDSRRIAVAHHDSHLRVYRMEPAPEEAAKDGASS